jgi:hypothetical protein
MHRRLAAPALLLTLCSAGCGKGSPDATSPTASSASASGASSAPSAPSASATADASARASAAASVAAPTAPAQLVAKSIPLPAGSGAASFDYLECDRVGGRLLVPNARDVGALDVYDLRTGTFTRVGGFGVIAKQVDGKERRLGPSGVSVGDGVLYVGNRGTAEVCAVDAKSLKLGKCLKLATAPDGVSYVASAREVWITTHDQSIVVLDAAKPDALKVKQTIKIDGAPEGYAIDAPRGLFFTNLEDKSRTLALDVKTHAVKSSWANGCGEKGPRGLVVDGARGLVVVACTDHVEVLDETSGATLAKLDTGRGVDNLDYLPAKKLLYVASGEAGELSVLRVGDKGELSVFATGKTAARARNAVADANGNAYVVDPGAPALVVLAAPKP